MSEATAGHGTGGTGGTGGPDGVGRFDLGIIGAGNMAEAIVRGVTGARLVEPARIIAADVSAQRREVFQRGLGTAVTEDNATAARQSATLLLCVKPQQAPAALAGIGPALDPATLVISIMAGVSTRSIGRHLGERAAWRVVRAMPNTPMLIGEGMVAICPGAHATPDDLLAARRLFESGAGVLQVTEDKMDAVTALSGSGPAYVFYLVEHMIAAGIDMGLTPEEARLLATRTAVGAGRMLGDSPESPGELRRKVTSPGGTTQAAIEHLETHHVGETIVEAILAAQRRSRELGG